MIFDADNPINALCAQGMLLEGAGDRAGAAALFQQAWAKAASPVEKCIAAHYVARHQNSLEDKLQWDKTALGLVVGLPDEEMKALYPSLYLNIGKGYEDIGNFEEALQYYQLADDFTGYFPVDSGYGNMIKAGIEQGLKRVRSKAARPDLS